LAPFASRALRVAAGVLSPRFVSSAGYAGRLDDLAQLVANKLSVSRTVVEVSLRADGLAVVDVSDRETAERAVRELGALGVTARVRGMTATSADERIEHTMTPGWTSAFAGEEGIRLRNEPVGETGIRGAIPNALFDSNPRPPARPDDTVVSREQLTDGDFGLRVAPADSATFISREPAPFVPPAPDAPVDSATLVSREPIMPPPDDSPTIISRAAPQPDEHKTVGATPIPSPIARAAAEKAKAAAAAQHPPASAQSAAPQQAPWSAALDAIRRNQQARPVAAPQAPAPLPPEPPAPAASGDSPWQAVLGPGFSASAGAQPPQNDPRLAPGREQTTFIMGTGDETMSPGARSPSPPSDLELPAAVVAPPLDQPIGVRARRAASPASAPRNGAAPAGRSDASTTWVLAATALIVLSIAVVLVVAATRRPSGTAVAVGPGPALIGEDPADFDAVAVAVPVPVADDASGASAEEIAELLVRAERACNRARFVECRELANSALQLDETSREARMLHIRAVTGLAGEGSAAPSGNP
jgi:hypothetical protein